MDGNERLSLVGAAASPVTDLTRKCGSIDARHSGLQNQGLTCWLPSGVSRRALLTVLSATRSVTPADP